jgi:hypothetical protein
MMFDGKTMGDKQDNSGLRKYTNYLLSGRASNSQPAPSRIPKVHHLHGQKN